MQIFCVPVSKLSSCLFLFIYPWKEVWTRNIKKNVIEVVDQQTCKPIEVIYQIDLRTKDLKVVQFHCILPNKHEIRWSYQFIGGYRPNFDELKIALEKFLESEIEKPEYYNSDNELDQTKLGVNRLNGDIRLYKKINKFIKTYMQDYTSCAKQPKPRCKSQSPQVLDKNKICLPNSSV